MSNPIYLASQSPRRLELLSQLNLIAELVNAPIEEVALPNEQPDSFVIRMAVEKALAGFNKVAGKKIWVIGGDTAVMVNGKVFGKPKHKSDAIRMLSALSGTTHQVLSAVAVVADGAVYSKLNITEVTLKDLTEKEIVDYWQTGEPADKAGGYAVQGIGAKYIRHLEGSYSGVMGLPLFELNQLLEASNFYREADV